MGNLFKKSIGALALGLSAMALTVTQAFAFEVVTSTVDPYLYNGKGGSHSNSDYAFRFDLSSDANWSNFETGLTNGYRIGEASLHVWLTPLSSGFNSDRHRVFTTSGLVTDNGNPKLTPINGGGIDDQVVRLKQELGISLDGVDFAIGQATEYEFDLTDWYDSSDLRDLVLTNFGFINVGSADDSFVAQGQLTVNAIANPEPATLFLFGTGLVGLAAWRLRKNQV